MKSQIDLVLYTPDHAKAASLSNELRDCPHLSVVCGTGPEFFQRQQFDALWMTGMHVTYWGLNPMASGSSLVANSPEEKIQQGFPPHIVAAWISSDAIDNTPARLGPAFLRLLIVAVEDYNRSHPDEVIRRIGAFTDLLCLKDPYERTTIQALKGLFKPMAGTVEDTSETIRLRA